jgi:mannose/fructose/sorbose-specific phosphotransferase system IIA component
MIGCVILTHGDLCFGLKNTLEGMMGKQEGLLVISNLGVGKDQICVELKKAVNEDRFKEGVVIFVDLSGSSCWQIAKSIASEDQNVAVLCGVNLPMLIKFFSKRKTIPFEKLVTLVKEEGEKGIRSQNPGCL